MALSVEAREYPLAAARASVYPLAVCRAEMEYHWSALYFALVCSADPNSQADPAREALLAWALALSLAPDSLQDRVVL